MPISTVFQKRINELVSDIDLTKVDLAKQGNFDYRSLSNALVYGIVPTTTTLIKMANYFNVSIDYLLGRTNINNYVETSNSTFQERFEKLCEEKGVTLIFYRTPYRSTANELRKANYFAEYCKENNLIFFDLEKEIEYDYSCDFYDFEHLSKSGAKKSTEFLNAYILEALQ